MTDTNGPLRTAGDAAGPPTAREYVLAVFTEVLAESPDGVDADRPVEASGLDSVTVLNIVARMERDLGELPVSLLYEYTTVEAVAGFLAARYPQRFATHRTPDAAGVAASAGGAVSEVSYGDGDIAVIGVSGRYPGASDVDELWQRLAAGDVCLEEVPRERWDWRTHFDERAGQANRSYSRWGGFLRGIDEFDPSLFKILPRDAGNIDPHERLFLETAWDLLEDAGHLGEHTRESETGVFVGSMYRTFGRLGARGWPSGQFTGPDAPAWSLANRVSHVFDLHGPSFTVDSACSSSLLAVHLAGESLRRGECRTAIAGGVNLILHPAHYVSLCALGMLSHDGACRVFDERADGFVPGEGVGAVLLKPLREAVADGDRIWAVIRSSHVNNDGRTSGYTVPNPVVQGALVAQTYRRAGVDPRTVTYVEAHGTGTALGDPIEIAGLRRAFEVPGAGEGTCVVGSIKANIGHLEGAAGIAGLTKVLLQLRHGAIAPCAGLETVNPRIGFAGSPLRPSRALAGWDRPLADLDGTPGTVPRRAGVSAFGAGGTNVHVLVEEYVPAAAPVAEPPDQPEHVVLLSAGNRDQLAALASSLATRLERSTPDGPTLAEVAYTSQVGRSEMAERCAVLAADLPGLVSRLRAVGRAEQADDVFTGSVTGDTSRAPVPTDDGRAVAPGAPVSSLLSARRLAPLARLWTVGAPVDWRVLWGDRHPARVRFPRYPFDRRRFPLDTALGTDPATGAGPDTTAVAAPRPAPAAERLEHSVEWDLRVAVGEFLMVDPAQVDVDTDILELGFDSISLTELVDRLNSQYAVDIPVTVVFDAPSVSELCRLLCAQLTATDPDAAAAWRGGRE